MHQTFIMALPSGSLFRRKEAQNPQKNLRIKGPISQSFNGERMASIRDKLDIIRHHEVAFADKLSAQVIERPKRTSG